ncbi:pentapeptide repeat-containing protein [Streptomyces sp. NPDC060194]|uniref:pentapeptide repeat-containing protein n=1 Tax=Streptomyces sp. NPDC060194 TaxID=3347069 RepID=UPI00365FA6E6
MSERRELRGDCGSCFGLCCVALPFARSEDFPVDKPAGRACGNLAADFRCGIHERLRPEGYRGCTVYDCFGAGQRVSQETFGGRDWRSSPGTASVMFEVFPVARQLHELLWYLEDGLGRPEAADEHGALRGLRAETERAAGLPPESLASYDVGAHRGAVNEVLLRVSAVVRAGLRGRNHRGADLMGARLAGARLRGASLRGAYLIAADLSRADLRSADVIGADLRDADLSGADLRDALFLTRPQLASARGDATTRLPATLTRPAHWAT